MGDINKVNINIEAILNSSDLDINNPILKKYDRDNNSVFSKEEIEDFCKDLNIFAAKDGDASTLSTEESVDFYNKLMSEGNENYKPIKTFEGKKNPVIDLINGINRSYDIKQNFQTCSDDMLNNFKIMSDENYEKAKILMGADEQRILKADEIYLLSIEPDMDIDKALKVLQLMGATKSRDTIFMSMLHLSRLNDKDFENIPKLLDINGRNFQLTYSDIAMAAQLPSDYIDRLITDSPNFTIAKLDSKNCKVFEVPGQDTCKIFNYDEKKQTGIITYEETDDGKSIKTQEDFRTNSKRVLCTDESGCTLYYEKVYYYDENGKVIKMEETVPGVGDLDECISVTDSNGKKNPVQWASIDPVTGEKNIEKHFTSLDGTKTDYYCNQMPDGSKTSEYKIVDKNGKILLNQKRTFAKISENKFISSLNDKTYEIEFTPPIITIFDKANNATHKIDMTGKVEDDNPDLWNLLKQMPGDLLIKLDSREFNKLVDDDMIPAWSPDDKTLGARIPETEDDYECLGILMHEFGHFLDTAPDSNKTGIISENEEFIKIYREELENLKNNAPLFDKLKVEYFADHDDCELGGRMETVAEANLLLAGEYTSRRASCLQKYFPRTIAKAAELLNALN